MDEVKKNFVDGICDILVKQKSVNKKEAESMREDFHNNSQIAFDDFLLSEGLVAKENILKALSEYYGVPSMDVVGFFFDHDLVRDFPKDFLLQNLIIPRSVDGEADMIFFVANNPDIPGLKSEIEKYSPYVPEFLVGLAQDIIDEIRNAWDKSPTYIDDLTDEDEVEDKIFEEEKTVDEIIDKERL